VIRNVLSNAVRHSRSKVWVSLSESAGGVSLVVQDDGPGVPEHLRERIFERFTRSDEARDRDSGGSGLGLAISRAILENHGGTISLDPSLAQGARFVIQLPVDNTRT
jgi:signal transduction histidine kinase